MELYIANYPSNIPLLSEPIKTARLERVGRIRKHARFYSKNLIASAASWDVERSETWDRLLPAPSSPFAASPRSPADRTKPVDPRSRPIFTKSYKHLLNIRPGFDEPEEEQDIEMQRYRSMVEKEWSGFMSKGFDSTDQKKLEFDLTESERSRRKLKQYVLARMRWMVDAEE